MRARVDALMRNRKLRGAIVLSSGAIVGQVLYVAALPIISRIYSPGEIGILSLVVAISSVVSPAAALRFESALLLPVSNRGTRVVLTIALTCVVTVSFIWALASVLIFFGRNDIPYLGLWVFMISLFSGLFGVFTQLAVRERMYRKVAIRSVTQSAVTGLGQVGLGIAFGGHQSLLVGVSAGRMAGIAGIAYKTRHFFGRHSVGEIGRALREYWRFPLVFAPSAVLNSLGLQLPLIMLTSLYGLDFAGQLGLAERVIAVPITVVGAAVGQVFIGELSKMRRSGNNQFTSYFSKVSLALFLVSLIILGLIGLSSSWLVPLVLGPGWTQAAILVSILAVTNCARLIVYPISGAILLFERARASLILDVFRVALIGSAIGVVYILRPSPELAVLIVYGSFNFVYGATWLYVHRLLRKKSRGEA